MSLKNRLKIFAEEARNKLMAQIESEMDADTAKVQWKGYNDDGMPNVKKGSKTKTADGQGYTSNPQNKNMILDKTGTVEYAKKTDLITPRYKKTPLAPQKPAVKKKKVAAQPPSSVTEFALAIIKRRVTVAVVIEYSWFDGRDLDNTTQIVNPISDGPVGWAHGSTSTYMSWSGDDTSSSGSELVTVDLASLYEDHGVRDITLTMRANWYATAGTQVHIAVGVLDENGDEIAGVIWTAPITYRAQGGIGVPVGSVLVKPNGTVTRIS